MGYMAEAIELIKDECVPRNLSAPPFGALEMRNRLAKFIDGNINKNPKSKERSDSKNDVTEDKDSIEIIEIIKDKINKPLKEKRKNSVVRKNNKNKTKEEEEKKKREEEIKIRQEEEKKKKEREKSNNNARTACKYFLTSAKDKRGRGEEEKG